MSKWTTWTFVNHRTGCRQRQESKLLTALKHHRTDLRVEWVVMQLHWTRQSRWYSTHSAQHVDLTSTHQHLMNLNVRVDLWNLYHNIILSSFQINELQNVLIQMVQLVYITGNVLVCYCLHANSNSAKHRTNKKQWQRKLPTQVWCAARNKAQLSASITRQTDLGGLSSAQDGDRPIAPRSIAPPPVRSPLVLVTPVKRPPGEMPYAVRSP